VESFDNIEIAKLLNENFIAIKVDRERRADIDEFYGNAMLYFIGQQGWPMSLFLTPDGKPFDGGGYYTFKQFKSILIENSNYWNSQKNEVLEDADKVMSLILKQPGSISQSKVLDSSLRRKAIKDLLGIVDNYNGGFGEGSKFPKETWLGLLLNDSYGKSKNNDSLVALFNTLTHIAQGGINDQLSGGFHRYATDTYWKVPHFEKMLYNQALLIPLYLRANNIKPTAYFMSIANQTSNFILNEMRDTQGGFYSALDADTNGEEGRFYLWKLNEWNRVLNKPDSLLFSELFDIDEYGEAVDGANVLYLTSSYIEFSQEKNISINNFLKRLESVKNKLLNERSKRIKPGIDKKIVMGWNGLTITALSEASLHLRKPEYLQAAKDASNFIWDNMRNNNSFYRIHYKGNNSQSAQLDDYAFYLQSLITLYDIDKSRLWLKRAIMVSELMLVNFWDKQKGGFYNVSEQGDAPLPFRPKSAFDKTLPSGNSVAAHMFIKLSRRTGDDKYYQHAKSIISEFTESIKEIPSAYSGLLIANHELMDGELDLPIYGARGHLRIDASIKPDTNNQYELTVKLNFDDGWHINSHKPFEKHLIPTSINLLDISQWQLKNIDYPQHDVIKLEFNQQALALYQGSINIKVALKRGTTNLNPGFNLQLQACNDKLCLPPENIVLYPGLVTENQ
ncbi:MAG: DUF255 domain-containing protein, partial [Methylococcales bacterium]